MTDLSTDEAQVLYDLDPAIKDDFEALRELHRDPESRWFARSRLAALSVMGLVAAAKWNPLLHPRGPDGRFIHTGGWVRWLLNGIWHTGRVESIDGSTGNILIRPSKDSTYPGDKSVSFSPAEAKSRLYRAPSKKASLKLPNPKAGTAPGKAWVKIGGQGGSNPGAMYEISTSATGANIYGDEFSLPAGPYGVILDKFDGSLLSDTALDMSQGHIYRNYATGIILRRQGNKLIDVQGNDFGLDPETLEEHEWDAAVFPTTDDANSAWSEMAAYATAVSMGDQFYVKTGKTADHTKNEALANYLYELAGVNVPDVHIGQDPKVLASKIVQTEEGGTRLDVGKALNDEEAMSAVRKDFAIDAWLANWDVVGLGLENIQIVDGVPFRIDSGGALVFRAQGSPKGQNFGKKVGELDSLKDVKINHASGQVFGKITDDELMDGVHRLAGISPEQIHAVIDATTGESFPDLGDTLVARRAYILNKYNVDDPYVVNAAETSANEPEVIPVAEPKVAPPVSTSVFKSHPDTFKQEANQALINSEEFFFTTANEIDNYQATSENNNVHLMNEGRLYRVAGTNSTPVTGYVNYPVVDVVTGEYGFQSFNENDDIYIAPDLSEATINAFLNSWTKYENSYIATSIDGLVSLPALINGSKPWAGDPNAGGTELASAQLRFAVVTPGIVPATTDWGSFIDFAAEAGGAGPSEMTPYFFNPETDEVHKIVSWNPESGVLVSKNINTGEVEPYTDLASAEQLRFSRDAFTYRYLEAVESKNDIANINNGDAVEVPSANSEENGFDLLSIMANKPEAESVVETAPESEKFDAWKFAGLPESETTTELNKKLQATEAAEEAESQLTPSADDLAPNMDGPGTSNVDLVKQTTLMPSDQISKDDLLEAIQTAYPASKSQFVQGMLNTHWDLIQHDWAHVETFLKVKSIVGEQLDKIKEHLVSAKNTDGPDLSVKAPADLGDAVPAGSVAGVSGKLSVHEKTSFATLSVEEAEALAESLVGKSILVSHDSWIAEDPETGAFFTTSSYGPGGDFGLMHVESYDAEKGQAILRRIDGKKGAIRVKGVEGVYQKPSPVEFRPVDNVSENDFKLSKPPTLKADGSIIFSGQAVGTWEKEEGYWSSTYKFKVDPAYTIFGAPFSGSNSKKMDLKSIVMKSLIPSAPPVKAKKKSPAAKKIEAAVAAPTIDLNPDGVLSDGSTAQLGDWLQATKGGGGHVGKLVGWPNKDQYPGLVFTVDKDGVQKAVNLKTQKKVDGPEGEVAETLPNAYTGITLKDGKTPQVGQLVSAGTEGKTKTVGIITNINTSQGWVYIQTPEGKKVSKTYSVTEVLEEPNLIWDVDSAIAKAAAATATPKAVKAKTPKTKGPKWPGKDGALITQDQSVKDAWLDGHPNRKLTKDGFVPHVGMRVRNNKGEEGVVVEVANEWDANPNKVRYYNIETKKVSTGSSNTIEIDHSAELYGWDGNDLKKVSKLEIPGLDSNPLPDGWVVYRYYSNLSFYSNGNYRSKKVPNYVAFGPDNSIGKYYSTAWNGDVTVKGVSVNNILNGHVPIEGLLEKIAVIDSSSDEKLVATPFKGVNGEFTPSALAFADNAEDPFLALNTKNLTPVAQSVIYKAPEAEAPDVPETPAAPEAPAQTETPVETATVAQPKILTASNLSNLPDVPAPPTPVSEESSTPAKVVPQPTGAVGALDQVAEPFKGRTNSILGAAKKMLDQKDSTAAGSASVYATGDSDYIEDMAVRYNVTKDAEGNEYLVARMRLREEISEGMADVLLTSSGGPTVKKGAWVTDPSTKFVDDLVEGDKLHVYLSGTTGLLKPKGHASSPNVTVVGSAVEIGTSNNYPLYRIQVMSADGSIGEVDIEKRETPSLNTFTWDHDKVVSNYHSYSSFALSSEASEAGWSMSKEGFGSPFLKGQVNVDASGKALEQSKVTEIGSGGFLLKRKVDTAEVSYNVSHRDYANNNSDDGRHGNLSGEVRIRIKIDGKSDEEIQKLISQSMETVGVPVEKQAPASNEQLTNYALNKLVTQYHPKYNYKAPPVTSPDDKRVQETLDHMNKTLKTHLGRDVTLNDLRIHTWDTGRIQVVVSPDVAKAITANQGNTHYTHGGANNNVPWILGGTTSGLMSTDERWSLGVNTEGMSSGTDMAKGSGDRVYMRGSTKGSAHLSTSTMIINPNMVALSTEVYVNDHDGFGSRPTKNTFMTHTYSNNEYMYKRKFEPEQIAFYTVYSQPEKEEMIEKLKKLGITEVNGRPVSSIILTTAEAKAAMQDPSFGDTGMDLWDDDVPIDTLLSGVAPGAVAASAEKFNDSAMIALIPSTEDSMRLAIDGYQPADDLHVTLVFLGESAWAEKKMDDLLAEVRSLAKAINGPIKAEAWATSLFNPKENPCSVYLVGRNDDLVELQNKVMDSPSVKKNAPEQYNPWIPHMAIGYGESIVAKLKEAGSEILFDRLRLAIGDINIDVPLGDSDAS